LITLIRFGVNFATALQVLKIVFTLDGLELL
jgi:hypothetical protein